MTETCLDLNIPNTGKSDDESYAFVGKSEKIREVPPASANEKPSNTKPSESPVWPEAEGGRGQTTHDPNKGEC